MNTNSPATKTPRSCCSSNLTILHCCLIKLQHHDVVFAVAVTSPSSSLLLSPTMSSMKPSVTSPASVPLCWCAGDCSLLVPRVPPCWCADDSSMVPGLVPPCGDFSLLGGNAMVLGRSEEIEEGGTTTNSNCCSKVRIPERECY